MKRVFKIILIISIGCILSGCSSNQLKCTKTLDNESYNLIVYFSNNKPVTATYEIKYSYDSYDAYIDMKLLELEEEYAKYNNISGLTYEIKEKDNDLYAYFKINYNLYQESELNLPVIKDNKINNRTNLELNGYKCK